MVDLSKYMKKENNKDNDQIFLFMKFTPREYIDDIIKRGRLRFGSILEYQKSSQKEVGDSLECVDIHINANENVAITMVLKTKEKIDLTGQVDSITINNKTGATHLLSLYKIGISKEFSVDNITNQKFIDERCLEFGDKCIIIWNVREFTKRVLNKLHNYQISDKWGKVKYIDKNQTILNLGEFTKTDDYEQQQEFRVCLKDIEPADKAFFLEIGNIEDITKVYDTREILENHSLNINIKKGMADIKVCKNILQFSNLKKIRD